MKVTVTVTDDPKQLSALAYGLIEKELGPGAFDDVDFIVTHHQPEHNDFVKSSLFHRDVGGCYEIRFGSHFWLVFTH